MHFVAPAPQRAVATDPGLEVILVNAKHANKPLKADALAQASLDGGGQADKGRAKSPLPDMRKVEEGDSVKASARRIAELDYEEETGDDVAEEGGVAAEPSPEAANQVSDADAEVAELASEDVVSEPEVK